MKLGEQVAFFGCTPSSGYKELTNDCPVGEKICLQLQKDNLSFHNTGTKELTGSKYRANLFQIVPTLSSELSKNVRLRFVTIRDLGTSSSMSAGSWNRKF